MSTNISKEKREKLMGEIEQIKNYIEAAPQDENTERLLGFINDIKRDLSGKKYGLVFEKHRESIDEILENNAPVLTEDEALFIDNGGQINFLIEGDNLASLNLLKKTHREKIDLIYIDPPYNTGNKDFVYDDVFVDGNDTFKHSKWLSFMEKRLITAKELLSGKGVIFISIDDNEQAQIKLMCDSVFGTDNFIALLTVASNSAKNQSRFVSVSHEYLLCYAKNKTELACLGEWSVPKYNLDDYKKITSRLLKSGLSIKQIHYELLSLVKYPKYYEFDHYTYVDKKGPFRASDLTAPNSVARYEIIHPITKKPCKHGTRGWAYSEETMKKLIKDDCILFGEDETVMPQLKNYLHENENSLPKSVLFFDSQASTKWLKSENIKFDFPKAIEYIKYVISMYPKRNFTCLDFFAGSGTTGHAVMKLNAEDGGNRKFILCTNNENNICRDVTYERIKRVIEKEDFKASLKYFKVEYVPISDRLYYEYADELLEHVKELVELENGINFNGNGEIAIILTDEELDDFTEKLPEDCKAVYMGHDVQLSEEQLELFIKKKISVNIIPDYYYRESEE